MCSRIDPGPVVPSEGASALKACSELDVVIAEAKRSIEHHFRDGCNALSAAAGPKEYVTNENQGSAMLTACAALAPRLYR